MKKYAVKMYFESFVYLEIDAENEQDAHNKASDEIDTWSDKKFSEEILDNISCCNDTKVYEI